MSFSGGNYLYQSGGGTLADNTADFNRLAQTLGQNVTKIQQNSQKIKTLSSRMNSAQVGLVVESAFLWWLGTWDEVYWQVK